jgi:hypothetical protein
LENSTIATFYSRNSTMQIGGVFKVVDMPQIFFISIISRAIIFTTLWTRKFRTTFKIKPNIKVFGY